MVMSDNGASREGGPFGVMDEFSFFNAMWEDIDDIAVNRLDDIGGPHSHCNYPWGWAQAGNSPLRWYKQNTYGGGVRDPLIVHWPSGIDESVAGQIRHQFCHAVDIAPTILEITGAPSPTTFNGHEQLPVHGRSIVSTFTDAAAPAPRRVQYFEQMGHRGIWADGWKATTYHEGGQPFENDVWELFHLADDFSECHNLAAEHPEKLRELIELWWVEAGEKGVLPLDDRTIELFAAPPRPGTVHARSRYVYVPPLSHIPSDASPPFGARAWTVTADVTLDGPATEGVLYARGSHNVGHSFFVMDGKMQFDYNALGAHTRVIAPLHHASGRHSLTARFDRDGKSGVLSIGVDGDDLASVTIPRIVRMLGSTGTDIGRDALSPVVDDYDGPFAFTGTIHSVTFEIRSKREAADIAALAATELARE
jgi:arylsulfatase